MNIRFIALAVLCGLSTLSYAQTLQLPDALQRSIQNYEKIKAKEALVLASRENTTYQKSQHLPDLPCWHSKVMGPSTPRTDRYMLTVD